MTGARLVAVVDQGSSSTKGAVVDARGRRYDEMTVRVDLDAVGRSVRHDSDQLTTSVRQVLDTLIDRHDVAAIGLTCQRSTCLLWERESGRALTPALSWQDTSRTEAVEQLSSHRQKVSALTGLRLSPHYAAPKLRFLIDQLADGRQRAVDGTLVAGTLDAFLVRQLTGRDGTEPGHAGRTLLYDLEGGVWSAELAEIFGLPLTALPPILPSSGERGSYRGIPLTAVAGDQQAALLGHGGWDEGVTAVHFGTGAFVLSSTGERLLRHPNALTAVLATTSGRSVFQAEATVNSAGSAVDWARRLGGIDFEDWLDRELEPEKLPLVVPSFRGLGAPYWQPQARAMASELTLATSSEDLFAATVAGVAMRVLDCIELLDSFVPVTVLRASGKLTRLAGLPGLLADAGQMAVETVADEEVGLLGIARLALAGLDDGEESLRGAPPVARRREPRWSSERARAARRRWRRAVEAAVELAR